VDAISVLIRSFNSAATIERTITSVRQQSVAAEIVLVDSGSTDATLALASPRVDRVITMPQSEFTFGRALNRGFEAAAGEIVHPLSSHCELQYDGHLARVLELHQDARVVATNGVTCDAFGRELDGPIFVNQWPIPELLWWGFSNHSSSVRRSVWERVPFDERLAACEDKEWAQRAHATDPSWTIAYDPKIDVPGGHRTSQGLRRLHRRGYVEGYALQTILPGVSFSVPTLLTQWVFWAPQNARLPRLAHGLLVLRWWEAGSVLHGARAARRDAIAGRRPALS
jgi:rhamnosyltransferase